MRSVVLAVAICVLAVSTLAAVAGYVGAWAPLVWGAIIAASIAFERYRYKSLSEEVPGPGWERTNERFVDDETGKTVTVYIERKTGERQYVQE